MTAYTVLYDPGCPLCSRFRDWLVRQPTLVPLELVPAASDEARRRFPTLDHARTLQEVTVVGDDGSVYVREHAWVVCLWATAKHRPLAERLATPSGLPLARGAAYAAAGLRALSSGGRGGDYGAGCVRSCEPLPQG